MLLSALLLVSPALAAGTALADAARQIRETVLDPAQCYRVRDLRLVRDEAKVYFTDGYLIFSKPTAGHGIGAVFSAETDGGEAELLLMPPMARERRSLAAFTKSPNLNEHFQQAILVFTDDTAAELMEQIRAGSPKPSLEMGNLLAGKYNSVLASFLSSFEVRLVEDLLSERRKEVGFFFAALGGTKLGNFDLIFDPRLPHQVSVGQVVFREERRFFDTWTNFEGRSFRMGQRSKPGQNVRVEDVRIDASIEPDLTLKATTRLRVVPLATERSLVLELSQRMKVVEATINGAPAEAYSPESLRANLLRGNDNNLLLLSTGTPLPAGQPLEIVVRHEGQVIVPAGDEVYFVSARSSWYPNRNLQFAPYDVTFRYPKHLDLVASGNAVRSIVEGDQKISQHRTVSPVRFFGFNLGDYEREQVKRGGVTVEVCANRKLEASLIPKPKAIDMTPMPSGGWPRPPRLGRPADVLVMTPPTPNPAARLTRLAAEFAATFEDLAQLFGKPSIETLTISPIPGRFGQGFPGLVYLSTLSYLDPSDRPVPRGNQLQQTFFSEILHAHEIAHQWWGNGVTSADYHDDWLMEALANYSALWALEHKKGARSLDAVLDEYRTALLAREGEETIESRGPVTLGHRLLSSQAPSAWSVITYQKGSWILHMLRRRMGDAAFQQMLAALYAKYRFQAIDTDGFQKHAASFLPAGSVDPKLDSFFDQWVNGVGVPDLKLTTRITGKAPKLRLTGTITQAGVDDEFSIWVPVEIQTGRGKPLQRWVQTANGAVEFHVPLSAPPSKVTLNPGHAVLAQ